MSLEDTLLEPGKGMFRVAISLLNRPQLSILAMNYLSLKSLLLASLLKIISWGKLRSSVSDSRLIRRQFNLDKNCYSPLVSFCERFNTTILERKYVQRKASLETSSLVSKNMIFYPFDTILISLETVNNIEKFLRFATNNEK